MKKSYSIKADSNQYILVESYVQEGGKADGQLKESNLGYYGTLEQLVQGAHNKMLLVHGLDQLEAAFEAADGLVAEAVAIITQPSKKAVEALKKAQEVKNG